MSEWMRVSSGMNAVLGLGLGVGVFRCGNAYGLRMVWSARMGVGVDEFDLRLSSVVRSTSSLSGNQLDDPSRRSIIHQMSESGNCDVVFQSVDNSHGRQNDKCWE